MSRTIPLTTGNYYHIYNKGVNGINLFYNTSNYNFFLQLFNKHVTPIADTFAWCLLGNHFHLLVRIKEANEVIPNRADKLLKGFETATLDERNERLSLFASKSFSNLFNSYAQSLNHKLGRKGTLFERPFRRKQVDSDRYFMQLVVYIHANPVYHGFTDDFSNYIWSSYQSIISTKPTKLQREQVLDWFGGTNNLVDIHKHIVDYNLIDHLIIE